ncbi:HEAT repeat domain-containing protein [Dyadobacter chenwenxiniae]|uniref:HEAT repeat domain-containing protein n=1 Tax=Dyadobacter chenwenxiniae TaxID=2906456 RepID=A0A9X1PJ36_9BACT|nr:HEAT repeat domain-containing protein [Dyadobacter chenwenxiniae]MCF0062332.1 HEAT repeat domain-containing protein [Dyadobacter chenwenxiniae]UON83912.1 HEAT repeat domain-containing protein [Dyadobacter chenwenxiniae]
MNQDIEKLLEKYYDGETTIDEEKELKRFFQHENVPEHLMSHAAQFGYFVEARNEYPSLTFGSELSALLDPPKQTPVLRFGSWLLRIAAGLALLIVGFLGGRVFQDRGTGANPLIATEESVSQVEIRNVLTFEKLASTSASERIQAINQSYDLPKVDKEITQLLINTLNFDPNINVRLAACQALQHFQNEADVAESLVQSLAIQTDPNIQIMLIEVLVSIKEKRAVEPFQQLVRKQDVMEVVKLKAQQGVSELTAADV